MGVALGFVVPASVVQNRSGPDVGLIGDDLFNMFIAVAGFTTALFVAILVREFMDEELQ